MSLDEIFDYVDEHDAQSDVTVADMKTTEAVYFKALVPEQGDLFGEVPRREAVILPAEMYNQADHKDLALFCAGCWKHEKLVRLKNGVTAEYERRINKDLVKFPVHFNAAEGQSHGCDVRSKGRTQRIRSAIAEVVADPDLIKNVRLSMAGFSSLMTRHRDSKSDGPALDVVVDRERCVIGSLGRLKKLLNHTRGSMDLRHRLTIDVGETTVRLSDFFSRNASVLAENLERCGGELEQGLGLYARALTLKTSGDLKVLWNSKDRAWAECEAYDQAGNKVRIQLEDLRAIQKFQDMFGAAAQFGLEAKELFICSPGVYKGEEPDDVELAVSITHPNQFMEVEPGSDIF